MLSARGNELGPIGCKNPVHNCHKSIFIRGAELVVWNVVEKSFDEIRWGASGGEDATVD